MTLNIKYNIPLAKYTSYKVGGSAKIYFRPENLSELSEFIKQLPITEELYWLGLGSNVLIRDGGINGAVVHTHNVLNNISIIEKNDKGLLIRVEAGVSCAKLAKFCVQQQLEAGIWFAGIPGNMGGALAMNAGAFGGETWEHVVEVEVINRQGDIFKRPKSDYQAGYRSITNLKRNFDYNHKQFNEWFVAGTLFFEFNELPITDRNCTNAEVMMECTLQKKIELLLQKRKLTQPIGTLNCGSVFKNPTNNFAARLIESSKLKGEKLGDAIVSAKHSNFIINCGKATALDLEKLIYLVREKVFSMHGILLELELKIIGELK